MEILENLDGWTAEFKANWLAHFVETGEIDWSLYNRPVNSEAPAGAAIDLSQSKLVVITTSGAYLPASQEPFDAENDLGDYTIRPIPMTATREEIDFAHTHYNQAAVREDIQVLIPIDILNEEVEAGTIGELAPEMISFMGYQPDVERVVKALTPAIVEHVKALGADAALLIPA